MRGSPPADVAPGFLQALRRYDPNLELYWHPLKERWQVYRVTRNVVPSMDRMVHEWEVTSPSGGYALPGPWLLELMKKHDIWSDHGDVAARQRAFRRLQDDLDRAGEREREKKAEALQGNLWKEYSRVKRGRVTVSVP